MTYGKRRRSSCIRASRRPEVLERIVIEHLVEGVPVEKFRIP